jgi:membrane fusion protein (multidrug efflux system)
VGEIRATIARKTIRAPFTGVLGIRQVNLGQYLSAGDPIVPLQALNPIHVDFGVPQQDAGQMKAGRNVRITAEELTGVAFAGRVTAIDSVVEQSTRNVQVQATLANPQGRLRPGMFVQTEVTVGETRSVITLPASAIQLRAVRQLGLRRRGSEDPRRPAVSRSEAAIRDARGLTRRPGGGGVWREFR